MDGDELLDDLAGQSIGVQVPSGWMGVRGTSSSHTSTARGLRLFRAGAEGPGERGRQIENFTRVEIYGFPEAHWLRVRVDARNPAVFTFSEQVVAANVYQKR
jgi:hypothetical protein